MLQVTAGSPRWSPGCGDQRDQGAAPRSADRAEDAGSAEVVERAEADPPAGEGAVGGGHQRLARPVDVRRDLAGLGVVVDAHVVPVGVGDCGRCAHGAVPLVVDAPAVHVVDDEDPVVGIDRVVLREVRVVEALRPLVVPDDDHVPVADCDRLVEPDLGVDAHVGELGALGHDGVLERAADAVIRVGAAPGQDHLVALEGPQVVGQRVPVAAGSREPRRGPAPVRPPPPAPAGSTGQMASAPSPSATAPPSVLHVLTSFRVEMSGAQTCGAAWIRDAAPRARRSGGRGSPGRRRRRRAQTSALKISTSTSPR